ncbi:S24 family peptidase [Paenibacillus glucanolyticus]|uniref:LexA family protein n=1 Tax=Paenibacillus glucanolyticus TaxID=59843 RepID=UPI0030CF3E4E
MGGFFYLAIDDSMSGDRIHSGDKLFVIETQTIQENDICAIADDTDVSKLRFRRVKELDNGRFMLVPSNPQFKEELKDTLLIIGKVETVFINT